MKTAVSRILRTSLAVTCALFAAMALSAQSAQTAPAQPAPPSAPAATIVPATAATATAVGTPQQNQLQDQQAALQQNQAQPQQSGDQANGNDQYQTPTITVPVNEVYLEFVVSDKHGRFIKDLKQNDFALLDDGKAPAQVYSFTQETNLPLRVGILIDTSTSIRRRFEFEQQAATAFLLSTIHPQSDKAFVEGFDVTPDYRQDWTNDMDALTRGIDDLRPGGGTALYDAVYSACRDKLLTSRGQEPVRKAIVLVSDGNDNQSHAFQQEAIKECQRADTIIYAISTNVSPSRDRGDDVLQKMATLTGGKAFFPTTVEEMPVSFQAIQDELRSQYALVYKPADFKADGSFRPIYLYCLDRRYMVRVREGYFAPKG